MKGNYFISNSNGIKLESNNRKIAEVFKYLEAKQHTSVQHINQKGSLKTY